MAVKERGFLMEFTIAGLPTSGACIVSNPMEVIKTRMQLQVSNVPLFFFSYVG
jgi:hypothetical protein